MNAPALMVRCAETNLAYMRVTPAGKAGYGAVVRLYERLAQQSLVCARAWEAGDAPPPHEPAVDAFWWGVAAWSGIFCADVVGWLQPPRERLLHHELQETFCRPHREFAAWLRPLDPQWTAWVLGGYQPARGRTPAEIVLHHDAAWTRLVIRLTARWGLRQHLKDLPALWQSLRLVRRLDQWPDDVAVAYLMSDLVFFRALFGHFPLSPEARAALDRFFAAAACQADAARSKR